MRKNSLLLVMMLAFVSIFTVSVAEDQVVTEKDCISIVEKAGSLLVKNGDEALSEINDPKGKFINGELYAFVYDDQVNMIANPFSNKLVGQNFKGKPDVKGKKFRDEINEVAITKGNGWVKYAYKKPNEDGVFGKKTYTKLFVNVATKKKYVVCSGMYDN